MAVDQLPGRVREFVNYLNGLLARLDQGGGWCAVFWQRDPDGMRACLEGREVPPWDVVEALLQDLAAGYGPGAAAQEKERARGLHAAALAAHDARPGGRDALGDRLDVMLREQRYGAERQAELGRLLASAATRQEADAVRLDLAWARDDHERATARCAELRARMADLDSRTADGRAAAIRRARMAEGAVYRIDREFTPDETPPTDGDEAHSPGFPHQRGSYDPGPADGQRGLFEAGAPGGTQPVSGGPAWARSSSHDHGDAAGQQGGSYQAAASGAGPAGVRSGSHEPGVAEGQAGGSYEATAPGAARPYEPQDRGPAGPGPGSHGSGAAGVRSGSYGPGGAEGQQGGRYEAAASGAVRAYDSYGPAGAGQGPARARAGAVDQQFGARGESQHRGPFEAARPGSYDGDSPSAQQRDAPATPSGAPQPAPEPPAPKQRKRRRGSARFAGMAEEEAAPAAVPPIGAPVLPTPKATGRTPRGARFAGAAQVAERPRQPEAEPLDTAGPREVVGAVERLVGLRAEGRSGEAHALLVDAAYWPAARFPLLAAELQRAGLGADWASLLWEAASLPADRLVAAADALVAAGRGDDGEQILRQGVARPATEIGQAVLALAAEGRHREVRALLDAYVRVRAPEEAARSAEPDPEALVPLLLEAAQGVSDERHWDLVHALRVAGFTA
ncbi:hypothetical protein [Streptomyces guryensis]|uniref:UL36 very large tegument protein n=1 Tax=Streptomyces guryensis TaxID=2886947 RepID=A0A9Q3VSN5_9ACTN|nr:hypothetical protein [Streptomyces guryensis]MCD9877067.1 hypothetical protein [Streptomyces guryensis]